MHWICFRTTLSCKDKVVVEYTEVLEDADPVQIVSDAYLFPHGCCTFSPGRCGRNAPLSLINTKWLPCTLTIISSLPSPLTSLKFSVTGAKSWPCPSRTGPI